MKINDNKSSIRGIFKYSEDVSFEKDDFVVDGNCIYICTVPDITGVKPSLDTEHRYYSEYPGNKIVSASEYYDYVNSEDRGLQVEDKYVSAHSLCEILENMYFGFGDNGVLTDHILYNPNTGIEYSIRGVHKPLDYSTSNVLNEVLKTPDLNNGLIRVSRNLPELNTLLLYDSTSESDVVILKQYTYLDSEGITPYRVQELLDPEKNRLYFRFAKGLSLDGGGFDFSDSIVSKWRSIYGDDSDVQGMLDTIEDYYQNKIREEYNSVIERMQGRYCYRSVNASESNYLGISSSVYLYPGETRDIKSIEDFTSGPCILDVLVKIPIDSNVSRNYSITIDAKDTADLGSEVYYLDDNITLNTSYTISGNLQCIQLSVSAAGAIIKDIYYRDKTLNHVHDWVLYNPIIPPTCTTPGEYIYECQADGCPLDPPRKTEIVAPLGHRLAHQEAKDPTCTQYGWHEYWYCDRCQTYFQDENGTIPYSGGWDEVIIPELGVSGHQWSNWHDRIRAKCTTPGIKVRTCTICGAEETETIPALGHDLNPVSELHASCGSFGVKAHYHCSRSGCGKNFEDAAGDYPMSQEDLKIYPSGNHTILNEISQSEVVQESTYSDYPNIYEPNPAFGLEYATCDHCGNKIEVSLPLKQHNFSNISQHELTGGPAEYRNGKHYPAYTEGYCSECEDIRRNYAFRDDIPINDQLNNHIVDHNLAEYTPATCDEYGFWKGTCTLCNAIDVIERDWDHPPTGHTIPVGSIEDWEPNTCTADAENIGTCSVCHANHVHAVDVEHRKIGHRDSNGDGKCDECNIPI